MPGDRVAPRSSAAERQQRYRIRQALGISLVRAEVDVPLLEALIDNGHLKVEQSEQPDHVGQALVRAARSACRRKPAWPGR